MLLSALKVILPFSASMISAISKKMTNTAMPERNKSSIVAEAERILKRDPYQL